MIYCSKFYVKQGPGKRVFVLWESFFFTNCLKRVHSYKWNIIEYKLNSLWELQLSFIIKHYNGDYVA